ncbi:MAG: hypothetical protein ACXWPG_13400 [Ktedonobacteraceae bacterium]
MDCQARGTKVRIIHHRETLYQLVERHDGRIWFESNEGHGSNFFMLLPLFQDDAGRE